MLGPRVLGVDRVSTGRRLEDPRVGGLLGCGGHHIGDDAVDAVLQGPTWYTGTL